MMRMSLVRQAFLPASRFAPWRSPLGAAVVVCLLAMLFAGAIAAALQPHPAVDALQAAVQGGL